MSCKMRWDCPLLASVWKEKVISSGLGYEDEDMVTGSARQEQMIWQSLAGDMKTF